MITRRSFFTKLSTGLVGAFIVSKVPVGVLPYSVQYRAACEYLRKYVYSYRMEDLPHGIVVSPWLWDMVASEIVCIERFSCHDEILPPIQRLIFKGIPLVSDPTITGRIIHGYFSRYGWEEYLTSRVV